MIFWFHGWGNNIDTALSEYGLSRQFADAAVNAVLVLPETARNAPDSYGGKLEQKNTFCSLVNDVLKKLAAMNVISNNARAGNIILAGHSGAYRVMARILQNGNEPVNEVILFDALYADTDKFMDWLTANRHHRFINLYTDHGGTKEETEKLLAAYKNSAADFLAAEDGALNLEALRTNKLVFLHTNLAHDDVIASHRTFEQFIQSSCLQNK